jgi:hypothetical protein
MAVTVIHHIDSFDGYATADVPGVYNVSFGSAYSIGAFGANGTNGLRITNTNTHIDFALVPNPATLAFHFHFRPSTILGAFLQVYDAGTVHLTFLVLADGKIEVRRGGSTGTILGVTTHPLLTAALNHIQIKCTIDDSAGAVLVKIGDNTRLNLTGVDTRNGASAQITMFRLGNGDNFFNTPHGGIDYDNLIVADDLMGERRVEKRAVNGAGNYAQYTPSAGSNYQNVDESTPDGDTTYNEGDTVAEKDTFAMESTGAPSTVTVDAVAVTTFDKKTDSGTRTARHLLRLGGTDNAGSDYSPLTSYARNQSIFMGIVTTQSDLDAMEAGYEVRS